MERRAAVFSKYQMEVAPNQVVELIPIAEVVDLPHSSVLFD
jgi:hypothetical protein